MSSVNSSVDTVNAAAAAIVTAESRVQPTSGKKRSWGSFWSRYWCFGTHKNTKRIAHACLFPDPVEHGFAVPAATTTNNSTSVVLPFIAPPSSPASFLQSDPPTASQSPGAKLTIASLSVNAYSLAGPANTFAIGPYAHETQLVSPPVFSAFTTEPSTAAVTPPPEPLQFTTPSSPDVPFGELLTKSLNRTRRNSGPNHRFPLSYYDLHQLYSGSPAGNLISPGSANSASGTSSPYPDRRSILELRIADASKLFDVKMFSTHKWGSRLGSGSLTPDGLGSMSRDILPQENQISEVASVANSETGSQNGEALVDHRLSFGLANEDIPTCVEKEPELDNQEEKADESSNVLNRMSRKEDTSCELCEKDLSIECAKTATWDLKDCKHRQSSISLGSVKEFHFESTDKDVPDKSTISTAWWVDGEAEMEMEAHSNWTFFSLVQPGVVQPSVS